LCALPTEISSDVVLLSTPVVDTSQLSPRVFWTTFIVSRLPPVDQPLMPQGRSKISDLCMYRPVMRHLLVMS